MIEVGERRRLAAERAASLVAAGNAVGLGTGRTAAMVVEALAARALAITCVATSRATEELARARGLDVREADSIGRLDIAIDGADEVDPELDLVKGLGGALVRERLVERLAARFVVVVDDEKLVEHLGRGKIPVEVIPFGLAETKRRLEALGSTATLRLDEKGAPFVTDNGNRILDLLLASPDRLKSRERKVAFGAALKLLPGVVDHGLFLGMATDLVVGRSDGTVDQRRRP